MELLEATMEQEKVSVDMSTLDPEDIERFKALFTSVDVDQSGEISNDELQGLFKTLEITATPEEIEKLIRTVDIDHSGNLSFDEFVTMICLMAANEDKEKEQHRENLRVVFDSVDSDKSGSISTEELEEMFKTLGYDIAPADIGQLIQLVDTDGNGTLDFDEFVALMDLFLKHEEETTGS